MQYQFFPKIFTTFRKVVIVQQLQKTQKAHQMKNFDLAIILVGLVFEIDFDKSKKYVK